MKHQIEYSKELGFSNNYLSTYRYTRKIPKDVNAEQVLKMYIEEKKHQDEVIKALQDMYYELSDLKKVYPFGLFLVEKGIYAHPRSLHRAAYRYFSPRDELLGQRYIKHHENVLNAYKEWCGDMQRLQPNART